MRSKAFASYVALIAAFTAGTNVRAQTEKTYKMTNEIPPQISTPDSVESRIGTLEFNDGFPTDETAERIYENLAFQRGVETFLSALPGGSAEAFRQGLASIGVNDNQSVAIFEDLMDSRSLSSPPIPKASTV